MLFMDNVRNKRSGVQEGILYEINNTQNRGKSQMKGSVHEHVNKTNKWTDIGKRNRKRSVKAKNRKETYAFSTKKVAI